MQVLLTPTHLAIVMEYAAGGELFTAALLHSQPKSKVGTPAYIAPEVLSRKEYDGKVKKGPYCVVKYFAVFTLV